MSLTRTLDRHESPSMTTHLGREDTVHGKNPNLLVDTERGVDLGSDELGTDNLAELLKLALLLKETLERHVLGCSLRDKVDFVGRRLEETVGNVGSDEAVSLSVPGG